MNSKEKNLIKQGSSTEDARSAISGMLSNTSQSFNQGNGSISSILGKNSSAINSSLGYSSGSTSGSTANIQDIDWSSMSNNLDRSGSTSSGDDGKQMSLDFGGQPPTSTGSTKPE